MTSQSLSVTATQPPSGPAASIEAGKQGLNTANSLVESHYRSIVKAVSWRATGTLDTIVVSFLVTGRLRLAISIGLVEVFTKIGLYYLHERLWGKIQFGRVKVNDDYQI